MTGFGIWGILAIVIEYVIKGISMFPLIQNLNDKIQSYIKFALSFILSEVLAILYVQNGGIGFFGLLKISVVPLFDAIISGILIAGGSVLYHELLSIVTNSNETKELSNEITRMKLVK